jgi:predicted aconitase with swiveling domain
MPEGRTLVPGEAHGPALVLSETLSFWGGLDPATGTIVDVHHPQRGVVVTGTVLVMPGGRGSSSSSSVLAEAIRAATAPAAIILGEPDPIIALGAFVARELYGASIPIVVLDMNDADTGSQVDVRAEEGGAHIDIGEGPS